MSSFMRLRHRSRVDLPQPDGPMRAVTWLAWIFMEMPCRAWFSPYQKSRSSISIFGCTVGFVGLDAAARPSSSECGWPLEEASTEAGSSGGDGEESVSSVD